MRRLLLIWCLLLAGVACISQSAAFWQSRDSNYNISIGGSPPPSYTGPGDVVSGAVAWAGFRAYNAAYASGAGAAFDYSCNSGVNTGTIHVVSTGDLNATELSAMNLICGVSVISITKMYDQSGANACTGAVPCDLDTNGGANPTLLANAIGSFNCAAFVRASSQGLVSSKNIVSTHSQPITGSFVAERTATSGVHNAVAISGQGNQFGFFSADSAFEFSGANLPTATAADNAFHAVQGIFNDASSSFYIDGSSTAASATPGTIGITASVFSMGNAQGVNFLNGVVCEGGWWPSGFSAGQQSAMNSNQHTYWGF